MAWIQVSNAVSISRVFSLGPTTNERIVLGHMISNKTNEDGAMQPRLGQDETADL